jgi:hypothetical protein
MLARLIGDWREATLEEIRLIAVAVAAAGAAAAAFGLACAAVFVAVTNRFGVVDACLTVAAVFLALTFALLALYVALRRRAARAASAARARSRSLVADPLVGPPSPLRGEGACGLRGTRWRRRRSKIEAPLSSFP